MFIAGLIASFLLTQSTEAKLPFLSPIFTSHMVLQRDRANTLWGWTDPGSRITVTIADHKAATTADRSGKWMVRIAPPPVGGPYEVDVDGAEHVKLEDVLVGDVWVCSGQSNMEMGIGNVNNAADEIANANYPTIRLYMVQKTTSPSPLVTPVGEWLECNPKNVAANGWNGFSAAAYFFGRELNQRLKVPIGLVDTCWGGTIAEAWTSKLGLARFPEFQPAIAALDEFGKPGAPTTGQILEKWMAANDPGSAANDQWAKPDIDESEWKATPVPTFESVALGSFDGVVWFRQEVDLPDTLPSGATQLQLGGVDDMDTTWVNGVRVGESFSVADFRRYAVPAGLLKPGKNIIVVRVLDTGGPGGIQNPDSQNILLPNGSHLPIGTGWKWRVGADLTKSPRLPTIYSNDPNIPTVLYNGMVAPIVPLAVKGAIWYQGESNADRAAQYQRLLPALINDWRKQFGQGDFPFFIVQLANFATRHPQPSEDAWAELREAQAMTVKSVRNTGLAVAIDIGDGGDIHPKDKQDVGLRLALAALHVAYGQDLPHSGPVYRSLRRDGASLRIRFDHTDGGLKTSGDKLMGFQIAGKDKKFVWADARIEGNEVVVSSTSVPEPVAVRYAWDMNPEATLYNGAGLPAVPFRSSR